MSAAFFDCVSCGGGGEVGAGRKGEVMGRHDEFFMEATRLGLTDSEFGGSEFGRTL